MIEEKNKNKRFLIYETWYIKSEKESAPYLLTDPNQILIIKKCVPGGHYDINNPPRNYISAPRIHTVGPCEIFTNRKDIDAIYPLIEGRPVKFLQSRTIEQSEKGNTVTEEEIIVVKGDLIEEL